MAGDAEASPTQRRLNVPSPSDPSLETRVHRPLLGSTSMKLRVALACAALLALGAWLAPRPMPSAAPVLSAPEERANPLIEQQVQARAAAQVFRGVQDVAEQVALYGVTIPRVDEGAAQAVRDYTISGAPQLPVGTGVVVDPAGSVLTHEAALAGDSPVEVRTGAGAALMLRVTAYEPASGLVLLRADSAPGPLAVPAIAALPPPGALVVGVASLAGELFVMPAFVSARTGTGPLLSPVSGPLLPGMPIYDTDGQLVAIAGDRAGSMSAVVPAVDAPARLSMLAASGLGTGSSLGFDLQPIEDALIRVYGAAGLLVADVVAEGPAAIAGIEPGDALLGIGGIEPGAPHEAAAAIAALDPGSEVTLTIARPPGRPRTVAATTASRLAVNALARTGGERLEAGQAPSARTLFTVDQLRTAGIPPGARVLMVNGRTPPTRAQAQADLRRGRTLLVQVDSDGRRFFAAVASTP